MNQIFFLVFERGQLKTLEKTSRNKQEIKQQTQPTINYGVEDGIGGKQVFSPLTANQNNCLISILQSCVADKFSGRVAQCNNEMWFQSKFNFECIVTKCISDPKYSQNINQAKLGIADHVLGFLGKV